MFYIHCLELTILCVLQVNISIS